ncbi:cytosolic 5'-nucleotidase 1A-like [Mastacembelus armatus]|uniref:cytosolic 5'-nucleotidase 1A-like n=1 Tax=Mastacembelus armatus TaxID=205130 RepID=UPI000E459823|nr:cytosolic 5'-nucleotidase 1A-like [Mastacembelus armatus]
MHFSRDEKALSTSAQWKTSYQSVSGPFKGFLEVLVKLQRKLHDKELLDNCPIRTYMVTSRGGGSPGFRALNTLHDWGLEVDEAFCLGDLRKPEPGSPVIIAISAKLVFTEQNMSPGPAFSFALKAVNAKLRAHYPESQELFKVILIDDNRSDELNNAIREHNLENLTEIMSGEDLINNLKENNTHLYLSESEEMVTEALNNKIAAAVMKTPGEMAEVSESELRIAFDGDAVLFSNESERVYASEGLEAFYRNEREKVNDPMKEGPFKGFLQVLVKLQRKLHDKKLLDKKCPIRTYLVTSRGGGSPGFRALNTLRYWGLEIDEAFCLGGSEKGPILEMIKPHVFFDDQQHHIEAALTIGIVGCHVPNQ